MVYIFKINSYISSEYLSPQSFFLKKKDSPYNIFRLILNREFRTLRDTF